MKAQLESAKPKRRGNFMSVSNKVEIEDNADKITATASYNTASNYQSQENLSTARSNRKFL